MTSSQGPSLDDLTNGLAEELEGVQVSAEGDVSSYARGAVTFARASSRLLEARLPEDIAEAALRTSDTAAIPGEPGWIRFTPTNDERHVADRAEAWFLTAWRHADKK